METLLVSLQLFTVISVVFDVTVLLGAEITYVLQQPGLYRGIIYINYSKMHIYTHISRRFTQQLTGGCALLYYGALKAKIN